MNTAQLGLIVESGSVASAVPQLKALTAASVQAEGAAERLAAASRLEASAQGTATAAARMHTAALHAQSAAVRMGAGTRQQLAFQLNDIAVSLASGMNPALIAMQQGSQIAQLGLANVGRALGSLVTKFLPVGLAVGAVTAGFAAMTTEINRAGETQVSMIDVMLASWQLLSERFAEIVRPITDWFSGFWDMISPGIASGVNSLIGAFDLAFKDIGTIWSHLPAAIGDATVMAAQAALNALVDLGRNAILELKRIMIWINDWADAAGLGRPLSYPDPNDVGWVELDNPWAGGQKKLEEQLARNRMDAWSTDYIGMIGDRARQISMTKDDEDGGKTSKALDKKGVDSVSEAMKRLADASKTAAWDAGSDYGGKTSKALDTVKKGVDSVSEAMNRLADASKTAWDAGSDFLKNLIKDGIQGKLTLESLGDAVGNLGSKLFDVGWNLLTSALMGGLGGGGGFKLPFFAEGVNNFSGGLAMVGERGPEIVRLPIGSDVIPNRGGQPFAANENQSGGNLQVTVITEVRNGNVIPTMVQIAGEVAGRQINQTVPAMIRSGAPVAVAEAAGSGETRFK